MLYITYIYSALTPGLKEKIGYKWLYVPRKLVCYTLCLL